MAHDAIVIGAGIGGLSAAIRLAADGKKVLILERNQYVGGKMNEISENGYRFDCGPSVITMKPVLEELFSSVGRRLSDYLTLEPLEPLTRYFYPNGSRLDISCNLPFTLEQIYALEPRDVEGYLAFLAYAARMYRITAPVFTFGPPPTPASFFKVSPLDVFSVGVESLLSLETVVKRYVRHPYLRQMLGRFATYVGSSPYKASATLAVIAHVELNEGIQYPRGGVYAIALALEKLARELGVEIRTGVEVLGIMYSANNDAGGFDLHQNPDGGEPSSNPEAFHSRRKRTNKKYRVNGVVLSNQERNMADVVIANLDVASVYEKLVPAIRPKNKSLFTVQASCSGFVMLLGVEGSYPDLAHHNIFFSNGYKREFEQIFTHSIPPDDPTIYLAITSKTDSQHAPPGCENWFVLVNVPADNPAFDWQANVATYGEMVKARLAENGFDARGRIRVEKILTPPDLERMNGARRGALYGSSFNDRLAPFKRPANSAPEVEGLFFVGGTTHPGGGVPMVMLSGKLVASLASEYNRRHD